MRLRLVRCFHCNEQHATKQGLRLHTGLDNKKHLYCSDCGNELEATRKRIDLRVQQLKAEIVE